MITAYEYRTLAFTTAAPGWRLWITTGAGKAEEVALAGWVTSAEVAVHDDDEPGRPTGSRSIRPGWVVDGEVNTTADSWNDADAWVIGPGERKPTEVELQKWATQHQALVAALKRKREAEHNRGVRPDT